MQRIAPIVLLALASVVVSADVSACGDKFLIDNSAFQGMPRLQPNMPLGTIAIYRNSDPAVASGGWSSSYEETLSAVGHTVWVIQSPDVLEQDLRAGSFDLLITDMDTAAELRGEAWWADQAAMLPYIDFPTRAQFKEAKATFGRALKVPTNATRMLTEVAKTLAGR